MVITTKYNFLGVDLFVWKPRTIHSYLVLLPVMVGYVVSLSFLDGYDVTRCILDG